MAKNTYLMLRTGNDELVLQTFYNPGDTVAGTTSSPLEMGAWELLSDGLDGFSTVTGDVSSDTYANGLGGIIHSTNVGIADRTVKLRYRGSLQTRYGATASKQETRAYITKRLSGFPEGTVEVVYDGSVIHSYDGTITSVSLSGGNIYGPLELTFTVSCPDPLVKVATSTMSGAAPSYSSAYDTYIRATDVTVSVSAAGIAALVADPAKKFVTIRLPNEDMYSTDACEIYGSVLVAAGLTSTSSALTLHVSESEYPRLYKITATIDGEDTELDVPGFWQVISTVYRSFVVVSANVLSTDGGIDSVSATFAEYEVIL